MNRFNKTILFFKPYGFFLFGAFILCSAVLLWWLQQINVNRLNQYVGNFRQKLDDPKRTFTSQERLSLEKDLISLEKESVAAQNAIYGTLVQMIGGGFFFVTAYFTWRNIKATEEKQITERFSKAVEQLGNEKQLEVRLGGIYSLERLSKDSPRDYWTVMEVITAFVREKPNITKKDKPLFERLDSNQYVQDEDISPYEAYCDLIDWIIETEHSKMPVDIHAALTVLGRRNLSHLKGEEYRIDLSGADFCWMIIPKNVNFRGMNLSGANFESALLSGIDLRKSELKYANFTNSELTEANFEGADLRCANLTEAKGLTKEQLSKTIIDQNTNLPDYLR